VGLAFDIGEIRVVGLRRGRKRAHIWLKAFLLGEVGANFEQGFRRQDLRVLHQARLLGARARQHECATAAVRLVSHSEGAADRPQITGEGKFARKFEFVESICRQLSGGGKYAQSDGQIKTTAFLRQIGRCEVDREPARRKFETGIDQCRAHPVPGFLYLGLRQTDDSKTRQPAGKMDFDRDLWRIHAGKRAAVQDGERHADQAFGFKVLASNSAMRASSAVICSRERASSLA